MNFKKLFFLTSPVLFLLAWSTGYPATVGILHYMSAITALMVRLGLIVVCLYLILVIRHRSFSCIFLSFPHIIIACGTGILFNSIGMMAVFQIIDWGYPAGLTALIYSMQPILLAIGALLFLGERLTIMVAAGLIVGFIGATFTIVQSPTAQLQGGLFWLATFLCLLGLIASTSGVLLNKYCSRLKMPYLRSLFWQYGGAFLASLPFYLGFGTYSPTIWNSESVFYIAWLVLPSSIGALLLMLYLLENHLTINVGSLLYLTGPAAALMTWILFGQTYSPSAIAGFVISVGGVFLIIRAKANSPPFTAGNS